MDVFVEKTHILEGMSTQLIPLIILNFKVYSR